MQNEGAMDLANPPPPPKNAQSGLKKQPKQSEQRPKMGSRKSTATGNKSKKQQELDRNARDLYANWVIPEDMDAFQKAISDDAADGQTSAPEKISAVSDFAPIRARIRRRKGRRDVVREGWAYHLSRWPLLIIIFLVIAIEFLTYLLVRQIVNIVEYFSAWRGERGKLRMALRQSKDYREWVQNALALDKYLHFDEWKKSPANAYYDSSLIRRVLRSLRELRETDDIEGVRAVLEVCLKSNFAGIESFRLYSETFYGTKDLIEEYYDEAARCIAYIRAASPQQMPIEEKSHFFRHVAKNLGASALCLSGGATLGYYHFGTVRALLDAGLLPKIITGTSAGAIVAAFACCRKDDELKELLTPELADRINACEDSMVRWISRWWRTGARFDTVQWAREASFFTLGNTTFKEAYERTGRILNVSVIPYDTHSPTKLLNYITAPDCVIYTAVIASAAVPGLLNPVVLMQKDKNGKVKPWEFAGKHKDGSLRVDIPLQALHLLYNVNFSIVSQVNPHIHLFNFAPRGSPGRPVSHRKGKGWRGGFLLSAAEQFLKLELTKNFRVIRDLELMPEFAGQNWSALFLQKFEGTVTIWPKSRFLDFVRILTDPDRKELARMIRVGQIVSWPRMKMIENRLKIERQIEFGRDEVFQAMSNAGGQILHRSSSYDDYEHRNGGPAIDSDDEGGQGDDESQELSSSQQENGSDANASRRRREIIAKLGLDSSSRRKRNSGNRDEDGSGGGRRRPNGAAGRGGRSFSTGSESDLPLAGRAAVGPTNGSGDAGMRRRSVVGYARDGFSGSEEGWTDGSQTM